MAFRYNGITGHRGNPARAPENTLESFENAMRVGVDFVETDVHLTADGRLMLCHNAGDVRREACDFRKHVGAAALP